MNNIDIANEQTALPVDELRLREIVEAMVEDEFPAETHLSLAVVDDKYEGAAASVVVLDASGKVVVSQTTCVGETA